MSPDKGIINILAIITFLLSLVSLVYGLLYIALPTGDAPLHNFFGVLFLVAFALNIILAYMNEKADVEKRVKMWGTGFLVFFLVAVLGMGVGGFGASNIYDPSLANLVLCLVVYPSFLGTFIIGLAHGWLSAKAKSGYFPGSRLKFSSRRSRKKMSTGRNVLQVLIILIMLLGVFFAYVLITDYLGLTQCLVSQYALFMSFFYLALMVLGQKVNRVPGGPFRYITGFLGVILFIVFLFPLFLMPRAIADAELSFAHAFGADWEERLDHEHKEHFRPYEFSLPAYFLSIPTTHYEYKRDVLYYPLNGVEKEVDEGLELYYDVYMPSEDSDDVLPGEGSTIVRIHGGAWIAGTKGVGSMMQMNKYFASQGYTVFDIQYGLSDRVDLAHMAEEADFLSFLSDSSFVEDLTLLGSPGHVRGPFTLDDIIRHLGIFSRYLEEHGEKYGASLDSVYFSGGSAGGHLCTAMALAIDSGDYEHIFSPEIEVSGYVPFYPGNKAYEVLDGIGGSEEWMDVEILVGPDSPPCLIYQGTSDGMVPPEVARSFYESYLEVGNEKCAVIYLPLAAHASDVQFAGYYNQLFLYYMERFLSLY